MSVVSTVTMPPILYRLSDAGEDTLLNHLEGVSGDPAFAANVLNAYRQVMANTPAGGLIDGTSLKKVYGCLSERDQDIVLGLMTQPYTLLKDTTAALSLKTGTTIDDILVVPDPKRDEGTTMDLLKKVHFQRALKEICHRKRTVYFLGALSVAMGVYMVAHTALMTGVQPLVGVAPDSLKTFFEAAGALMCATGLGGIVKRAFRINSTANMLDKTIDRLQTPARDTLASWLADPELIAQPVPLLPNGTPNLKETLFPHLR